MDVDHLTRFCRRQRSQNGGYEQLQISKAIGRGVQNNDRDLKQGHFLLRRQVAIDGQEDVEMPLRKFGKLAV
ncbi:MAG: hypothetical protein IH983_12705 [Planctomycetes bacterium]|nr:hypothetical protein [Planctomycetota bacterium]